MENYSLSDIRAATEHERDEGFGGGAYSDFSGFGGGMDFDLGDLFGGIFGGGGHDGRAGRSV